MHQGSHLVLVQGIALTTDCTYHDCSQVLSSPQCTHSGEERRKTLRFGRVGSMAGWGLMEVPDQCNVLWWELSHSLALK